MQKNLSLWQLAGLTFTAVLGTILHFLYGWVKNPIIAAFSAVNESTWEHMKLLFIPALLFSLIEYPFFHKYSPYFWQIKCTGILIGLALIPILFYTLSGIFGKTPAWLNVLIYFIAITATYYLETHLFKRNTAPFLSLPWSIGILSLIALSFILYTFLSPQIPLFQDPITGGYGIHA